MNTEGSSREPKEETAAGRATETYCCCAGLASGRKCRGGVRLRRAEMLACKLRVGLEEFVIRPSIAKPFQKMHHREPGASDHWLSQHDLRVVFDVFLPTHEPSPYLYYILRRWD